MVFSLECIPGFINLFHFHKQFLRGEKKSRLSLLNCFHCIKKSNPLSLNAEVITLWGVFFAINKVKTVFSEISMCFPEISLENTEFNN